MNLPNLLTLIRLFLIPGYLWAFYATKSEHKVGALIILLLAGATDILDGYIARHRGQETQVGQLLDPLADKLMMVAVLFSLIESGRVPWLWAGLLVFRDVVMIVGATFFHFQGKRAVPKANKWGKATTVAYYITVCAIILALPTTSAGAWFMGFTVILSYITSVIYVASMQIIDIHRRVL
ncbi:CDP-alcohol phosphatidyltransferase family protein [Alicyclobacillus sp. ALC3]|uniref:CDP-alcohol phosphatidyltransferase family protein n=1 Tax=Alicyclobacillus sp. ALC3 TaxID=2796143 RepID=UPI002378DE15|nr:CDP-alcohol phosphatidyltransferase family protein [Alicyclobacillus sp. ALC3]WDL95227.1 CDP-alcohol phosphatidyltransferase family protein [Alicyclobacillus sp. ALC3]